MVSLGETNPTRDISIIPIPVVHASVQGRCGSHKFLKREIFEPAKEAGIAVAEESELVPHGLLVRLKHPHPSLIQICEWKRSRK